MADDIGQIRQDIGSLLQGMKNAENQRTTIFDKLDEYGKELVILRQDHNALSDKVSDEIEPVAADYKRTKQRGLGILGGIVFAAGGVSAAVTKAFQNLFPNH